MITEHQPIEKKNDETSAKPQNIRRPKNSHEYFQLWFLKWLVGRPMSHMVRRAVNKRLLVTFIENTKRGSFNRIRTRWHGASSLSF